MKHKKINGFTLVEMLIVLLVVSVLLLLMLPNIVNQSKSINNKGCKALVTMLEGQVQTYKLEKNRVPSLSELVQGGYIKDEQQTCPNGNNIIIDKDGRVSTAS
ncbi:ComG operon protein 3 precursor [Listeria grayi]|nr:competence type IV pilus major pilin ComGC [Listeria grayi]VEI33870.1 ComG operon protein 3 precursor [Listeria grayi]